MWGTFPTDKHIIKVCQRSTGTVLGRNGFDLALPYVPLMLIVLGLLKESNMPLWYCGVVPLLNPTAEKGVIWCKERHWRQRCGISRHWLLLPRQTGIKMQILPLVQKQVLKNSLETRNQPHECLMNLRLRPFEVLIAIQDTRGGASLHPFKNGLLVNKQESIQFLVRGLNMRQKACAHAALPLYQGGSQKHPVTPQGCNNLPK